MFDFATAALTRLLKRSAKVGKNRRRHGGQHDLRMESLEDRRLLTQTVGLFINEAESFDGYTLLAPTPSTTTYLIDNDGNQVHSWESDYPPMSAYLLENGDLLRTARLPNSQTVYGAAGASGRVEQFDWDGNLVWSYELANAQYQLHHDIEMMPNGNILMIAWERLTRAQAIAGGRDPASLAASGPTSELWPDMVIEVEPDYVNGGGDIVWEWRLWDHVVQNKFNNKGNFGSILNNPQLVNLNYWPTRGEEGAGGMVADWTHFNSVDYSPELDQIVVSSREFSEFWVIDHSTTMAEAASHSGGNADMGGDILYRWGNPKAYGRAGNQEMWYQHNAQWIEPGLPGEGNILVFDNGWSPTRHHSSVQEIVPPLDGYNYALVGNQEFAPANPVWEYTSTPKSQFFAPIISGAQRLPNGNTLIDEGTKGEIFEVTPDKDIVWFYVNPVTQNGPLPQGAPVPAGGFPVPGVLANLTFRALRYAPEFAGLVGRDLTPQGPIELPRVFYDTVGVYDQYAHKFWLNNKVNGETDDMITFETPPLPPSWIPLTGDWDNDGDDTVGVYDPSKHTFYLNDEMVDRTSAGVTKFVTPPLPRSWIPVAGNWDGEDGDSVGVYDPVNRTFYLNDDINGSIERVTKLVMPRVPKSWKPITGDWDGDGRDTVGLYNPNRDTFHLYEIVDGKPKKIVKFITPPVPSSWIPISGDWNGNGIDTVGLYDQQGHTFYLNNKTNGEIDDLIKFVTPPLPSWWIPITGNWNASPDATGPDGIPSSLMLATETPSILESVVADFTARIDADGNGQIGFGDFSYFASVFGKPASDPAATLAQAYDFDNSGVVDFGDFSYFSANFMRSPAQGDELVLPPGIAEAGQWPGLSAAYPLPGVTDTLTADQLAPIVAEAKTRLLATEGSQAQTAITAASVVIADLSGSQLGRVVGGSQIEIDINAAGRGWFADLTPGDDLEFLLPTGSHELTALPGSPAYGSPDLLTVVMHELGHLVGYAHGDEGVMQDTMPLGTRRVWEEVALFDDAQTDQAELTAIDAAFTDILHI